MPHRTFILSLLVLLLLLTGNTPSSYAQHSKPNKKVTRVAHPKQHAPTDTVAIINGDVITYHDFNSIMAGYLQIFVKRTGDNVITDSLYSIIVDSAWNKAVSDILIEQEIAKRHLSMSDSAVKQEIVQNPPEFLRQQFIDSSGRFHQDYLAQAVLDPRNDSLVRMLVEEERVRLETERLVNSVAEQSPTKCATVSDRERAFDAWLRKAIAKAKITDRRLSFGFY